MPGQITSGSSSFLHVTIEVCEFAIMPFAPIYTNITSQIQLPLVSTVVLLNILTFPCELDFPSSVYLIDSN